jgi:hypothetical protein
MQDNLQGFEPRYKLLKEEESDLKNRIETLRKNIEDLETSTHIAIHKRITARNLCSYGLTIYTAHQLPVENQQI